MSTVFQKVIENLMPFQKQTGTSAAVGVVGEYFTIMDPCSIMKLKKLA